MDIKKPLNKCIRIFALSFFSAACVLAVYGCGGGYKGYDPKLRIDDERGLTPQEYSVFNTTGVDDFGRLNLSCDGLKTDKKRYVGMFYFLWLGTHSDGRVYDVTKILAEYGREAGFNGDYAHSPLNKYHHWGEPLYGYYDSTDEWVIRKQLELLTFAGVDFLAFDCTNTVLYQHVADVVLPVMAEYRAAGWPSPQAMFYFGGGGGDDWEYWDEKNLSDTYDRYYANPELSGVWFAPEGKPWVVVRQETAEALSQASHPNHYLSDAFEFKYRQWPDKSDFRKTNGFPWIDFTFPQSVYRRTSTDRTEGVINVSVAQHVNVRMSETEGARGRGWGGGFDDGGKRWKEDLNLQGQWKTVFENGDAINTVFVTSWNEWIAMKFGDGNTCFTVDQFNDRFSRDIEPSKTDTKDNTYMLTAKETRGYKMAGARHYNYPLLTPAIDNASDAAWGQASHYVDFAGEAVERRAPRYDGGMIYEDDSNRNDITDISAARDKKYIYFKITCKDDITQYVSGDTRWMNINLNTQNGGVKDARGYQYVINRAVSGNKTDISRAKAGGGYEKAGEGDIFLSGKDLVVRIPLKALALSERNYDIEFKVTDNVRLETDPLSFYTTGDSAPCGRLNYKFGY